MKQRPQKNAMYWLAPLGFFSLFAYTSQTTCPGIAPPTSIINQGKILQCYLQPIWMGAFSQLRPLFTDNSSCVKLGGHRKFLHFKKPHSTCLSMHWFGFGFVLSVPLSHLFTWCIFLPSNFEYSVSCPWVLYNIPTDQYQLSSFLQPPLIIFIFNKPCCKKACK